MNLTLTLAQMLGVFEKYNLAVWPMQVLAFVLGLVALFFALKPSRYASRIVSGILCLLWLWTGVVFHLLYFGPAYAPAYGYGVLFIIQGVLFLVSVFRPQLSFGFKGDVYSIVGLLFIAYALVGYPVLGYFLGHAYPQTVLFGFPCPTTVFTFGLFLLTDKRVPKRLLPIPFLWGLVGLLSASIGVWEDLGLFIAGVLGTAMILYRDRKRHD